MYKEALERAISYYCELANCRAKDELENIFPELAGSEDEKTRRFLLDYAIEMIAGLESDISRSTYDGIKGHDPEAEAELTEWQKARVYLEKQKEQKPAEWSEEDEEMLEYIIGDVNDAVQLYATKSAKDMAAQEIEWLKSLRPSWKPSEEMRQNYIRKDAILELLQGMIQSCKTKNGFPVGTLAAVRIETLETVISQIEEICKEERK